MKIKIQMLGYFKKGGLFTQLSIIIYIMIMFSGSTFLRDYVSNLVVVLICLMILMISNHRFGNYAIINTKDKWPFIIMVVFSAYLFWQMYYVAYVPSIVWTYVKRFLVYSLLFIFIPRVDMAVCAVKLSKYYSFIVACSIIISTLINGQVSGGLVGDYQAAGMMMSISSILFMIDYFNDKNNKMNLVGLLLAICGLLMSGKRMFALIVVFSFVLIYLFSEKSNKQIRFWGAIILLVLGVVVLYITVPAVRELFTRIVELSGDKTRITSGRNVLWEKATDIFKENKAYGIGFGAFQNYFADHYNISGIQAFLTHNIYYGLLAETGIIGFGLFVFLMVYMMVKSIKIWKNIRTIDDYNIKYLFTYAILMQIWFIVYGYTGNGIYDANETFFYFSAIAMILSIENTYKSLVKKNMVERDSYAKSRSS